MRPVRRRQSPFTEDLQSYHDAKPHLIARLGSYCSYCERKIATGLHVEHIHAKSIREDLKGRWDNFLLSCINCNSIKGDKPVDIATMLLPDRDNTFIALRYAQDGAVQPSPDSTSAVQAMANALLDLVGLNKKTSYFFDENEKLVAQDRVTQRSEAWSLAQYTLADRVADPANQRLLRAAVNLASATGFFSIWMSVFTNDVAFKQNLLAAFPGTAESLCFSLDTISDIAPAANPDNLNHGGKS